MKSDGGASRLETRRAAGAAKEVSAGIAAESNEGGSRTGTAGAAAAVSGQQLISACGAEPRSQQSWEALAGAWHEGASAASDLNRQISPVRTNETVRNAETSLYERRLLMPLLYT